MLHQTPEPTTPQVQVYEAPALVVIGTVDDFTFGSKNNGNDGVAGQTKN